MIQLLVIEFNDKADEMEVFFDTKCEILKKNGIHINCVPILQKQQHNLHIECCCYISYNNRKHDYTKIKKVVIFALADKLSDYIIYKYEQNIVSRIIDSNYCYFNAIEKKKIMLCASKLLEDESEHRKNSELRIRSKNIILKKLEQYLHDSNELIMEGFVNFRLADYFSYLEDIVDKSVDEYLIEKEYKEFILLLRYFIDVQIPKHDTVNIFPLANDKYVLLDNNNNQIISDCDQEFLQELNRDEISNDDLLISTLITIAPRKIVIHCVDRFNNKELLETIKSVFYGRYYICNKYDSFLKIQNDN